MINHRGNICRGPAAVKRKGENEKLKEEIILITICRLVYHLCSKIEDQPAGDGQEKQLGSNGAWRQIVEA